MSTLGKSAGTALVLTLLITQPVLAQDAAAKRLHAEAVAKARANDYAAALPQLEELTKRYPDQLAYRYDYIAVSSWSGDDARALAAADGLDVSKAPIYVIEAAAKSARNRRELNLAAGWYEHIVRRDPKHFDGALGWAQVLVDLQRFDDAARVTQQLTTSWPEKTAGWLVHARVHEAKADWIGVLDAYQRALALEPTQRDAIRGRVFALARLGAPHAALSYAETTTELFTPQELDGLRHDQAIVALRWSRLTPARAEAVSADELDAPVAGLSALLRDIEQRGEGTSARAQQVRHDLVVALAERRRDAEALALFDELVVGGSAIPNYTRLAAAGAVARTGDPARAVDMYKSVLEQQPNDVEATEGLIYALFDLERHAEAEQLARAWAACEPRRVAVQGRSTTQENWRKLRAERLVAKAMAYDDRLQQAQAYLEPMVKNAPQHAGLRVDLGYVYLWRGFPRRAQEQFELVLATDPQDTDAQRGVIAALLDQGEYGAARERWHSAAPSFAAIQNVGRSIERRGRPSVEWLVLSNNNTSLERGSNETVLDARYYSRVSSNGWRGTAGYRSNAADLSIGRTRMQRLMGGASWLTSEWDASAELSADANDGSDVGLGGRATWHANDQWRVGLGAESYMQDLPLAAYARDIDATRVFGDLGYRVSENRRLGAHAERAQFSDDNTRTALSGYVSQNVWSTARQSLDGGIDVYTSRNTIDTAPYFNPKSDHSVNATLVYDQRLWRKGDASWRHRVSGAIGNYWQENYGGNDTWQLRYQHTWQPVERVQLALAVRRSKPVYDGNDEFYTEWTFSGGVEF